MIQNFIKMAMFTAVQNWFSPGAPQTQPPSPFRPNVSQIKVLAVHYASLFTLLFLNFLLFMGGLIVTAVAAAHSFDVYGHFVPSAVLWTGIVMGGTGLTIAAITAYAIGKTKVTFNDVVLVEPEVQPVSIMDRLVRPFFEGVLAGLQTSPRTPRYHGENESYPAA